MQQNKRGYKHIYCNLSKTGIKLVDMVAVVNLPDNITPSKYGKPSEFYANEITVERLEFTNGELVSNEFLKQCEAPSNGDHYYPGAHIKRSYGKGLKILLDEKDVDTFSD